MKQLILPAYFLLFLSNSSSEASNFSNEPPSYIHDYHPYQHYYLIGQDTLPPTTTTPLPSSPIVEPTYACPTTNQMFDSANSTISLRHVDPGGIGYDHGYTTLAGLYFPGGLACNTVWPFIDLRAHYFNDNDWAANGGIGIRYAPDFTYTVLGVNAYFDYRTSDHWKLHYTQIGLGIEALGLCWEFRVNGYYPLKDSNRVQRCEFFYPGDYFIRRDRLRNAMRGLTSELGRYICRTDCFELYVGAGPYFYRGHVDENLTGGRFRVFLEYARWLTIGGILYYDNVFHTRVQGLIGLNFTFGCAPRCCRREQIISQPTYRNEIIVLDDFCCWKFNYDDTIGR